MQNIAHFEPVTWWWTRKRIGESLQERYPVPKELPPRLLKLVMKLDTAEGKSGTLVSKLDAIEGKYLLRRMQQTEPRRPTDDDWPFCT